VLTATCVDEALERLEADPVHLVITDLRMPRVGGLNLVRYVRENRRDMEVIVITGYPSIEGAVKAVNLGAGDYLAKPFTEEELLAAVRKAIEKLRVRLAHGEKEAKTPYAAHGLIGNSRPMKKVFRTITKAAATSETVLVAGESGTGKELVARAIHYGNARSWASFVPVNCGAIPEGLLESELFGHVKGAFTGATESRAGFFQTAEGGTIFLDEVSETSLPMQVKLLRVLQDKQVFMVGSSRSRKVNVRIIVSTNKDLRRLVDNGLFREDLFFRLNVITIDLPPLRERNDDILLLIQNFSEKFSKELDREPLSFSDAALKAMRDYHWPGNVRELENVIKRLVVLVEGNRIDVSDLPSLMRFSLPRKRDLTRTLAEVEAEYARDVLASVGGNRTKAADILGISRPTLREKLKAMPSGRRKRRKDR
jgi:DNA-binding NtrC family response regulator